MADNDTRTGGTSGTGEPDAAAETLNDTRTESDIADDSLSAGDASTRAAIGGGDTISGTGGAAGRSGRSTTESGSPPSSPPDPGDPGGMGGVATNRMAKQDRPPGGVSPMVNGDEESERR
jgi:hypothetical protein